MAKIGVSVLSINDAGLFKNDISNVQIVHFTPLMPIRCFYLILPDLTLYCFDDSYFKNIFDLITNGYSPWQMTTNAMIARSTNIHWFHQIPSTCSKLGSELNDLPGLRQRFMSDFMPA